MLSYQGAQNIVLSNHKLESALNCTVWSQCTPVPDKQTDRRTNIAAIARRYVLTNASHANIYVYSSRRQITNTNKTSSSNMPMMTWVLSYGFRSKFRTLSTSAEFLKIG